MKTPNAVPNDNPRKNQCRYCRDQSRIAKECPKLAKQQNWIKTQMHQDTLIVTIMATKNLIVTLEQTWKIVQPSGHLPKLSKSIKNPTNPLTHETQNLRHRSIKSNKATSQNKITTEIKNWQHSQSPKPNKLLHCKMIQQPKLHNLRRLTPLLTTCMSYARTPQITTCYDKLLTSN